MESGRKRGNPQHSITNQQSTTTIYQQSTTIYQQSTAISNNQQQSTLNRQQSGEVKSIDLLNCFASYLCVEMSTSVISDAMVMPAMESQSPTKLVTEVESVKCDCCGLTEECTPEYIERIRERFHGNWICGLCAEAVKDEIVRSERLISTEEAVARHLSFCRTPITTGTSSDPTVHLIAAMRQLLRRSLDSTAVRSVPCSPTTKVADRTAIARSESCIPNLTLASSLSFNESNEDVEIEHEDEDGDGDGDGDEDN